MDVVLLIKHAMPEIDIDLSPEQWTLGEAGRVGASQMVPLLAPYAPTRITTSTESKAAETGEIVARALGLPVEQRPDLHEHERSNVRFMETGALQEAVARIFEQPDDLVFGMVTARDAAQRFGTAIDRLLGDYASGSLAVATHGTVISLFVAERAGGDPFALWLRLGLPSFVVLSRPDLRLLDVVERVKGEQSSD